jgi:uncharacterized damage-inducible protein DinB
MNADHARLLADHYAGVFDQEGAITTKVLKAVPDSGRDPETEKRMTAGFQTVHDVVEYYTREFPKRIQRLRETPGEKLAQEVDFFGMKMPPVAVLPMANNHSIHHRGQLAAYLRAAGSKVPSIYGGSADEPFTPASA